MTVCFLLGQPIIIGKVDIIIIIIWFLFDVVAIIVVIIIIIIVAIVVVIVISIITSKSIYHFISWLCSILNGLLSFIL